MKRYKSAHIMQIKQLTFLSRIPYQEPCPSAPPTHYLNLKEHRLACFSQPV